MSDLSHPDCLHYDAATGWLMLGDADSAWTELQKLAPAARRAPAALELEWGIQAERRDWAGAVAAAQQLVDLAPECTFGWVHRAYAARRLERGGLSQAWELLRPALDRFPKDPTVAYNLACYAAQMGREEEAWSLLQRALAVASKPAEYLCLALTDDDLKVLWPRIHSLRPS